MSRKSATSSSERMKRFTEPWGQRKKERAVEREGRKLESRGEGRKPTRTPSADLISRSSRAGKPRCMYQDARPAHYPTMLLPERAPRALLGTAPTRRRRARQDQGSRSSQALLGRQGESYTGVHCGWPGPWAFRPGGVRIVRSAGGFTWSVSSPQVVLKQGLLGPL